MSRDPFCHALVAGGSMAGLLAARVLADHFQQVTLIERDALPRLPEPRKGVPQGQHVHVLLLRGHAVLEDLFPDITHQLRAAGAVSVDCGRELVWHHTGAWRSRYDSELRLLSLSRSLLETRVAERVRALSNVKVLEGVAVQGLKVDNGAVASVFVDGAGRNEAIDAGLVVDATGRGSAAPQWLKQLGYEEVVTDQVPARVTYSTCLFRRHDSGPDWQALIVTSPGSRRIAFALAIEGNRWMVTLSSLFDESVPQDQEEFLTIAKSLPTPELYGVISGLEPLSRIVRYRFAGSHRRRYERLKAFPQGLLVIGDSVSSFNPVYGQGMTVAALEAEALGRLILEAKRHGRLDPRLGRRWFRDIGKIIDRAWQGVSIEDFRLPELAAHRPVSLRPLQWYMDRVHRATHRSAAVTDQFYRVIGFLDPPTALFRPRIVVRVLSPRTGSS